MGHSCFRLKGKKAILVVDPYHDEVGFSMPEVSADIVVVSRDHPDHNNIGQIKKTTRREPFVISAPGEYEVEGIFIFGLAGSHGGKKGEEREKNIIFSISFDNLRLVHLGDLGEALTDAQIDELGKVDILFMPVGGAYTLDAKAAAELVGRIEPRIVIPMRYLVPGVNERLGLENTVEDFLKELGVETEPVETLNVLREKLPDEREVVVLKRK